MLATKHIRSENTPDINRGKFPPLGSRNPGLAVDLNPLISAIHDNESATLCGEVYPGRRGEDLKLADAEINVRDRYGWRRRKLMFCGDRGIQHISPRTCHPGYHY